MTTTTCRSCGAPIIWVEMKSGRRMPCNAVPKKMIAIDQFNGRLGFMVSVYESHFSTCPYAKEHRQRGKNGNGGD